MDFNQRAKRIVDMSVGLIPKEEPPPTDKPRKPRAKSEPTPKQSG